MEPRFWFFSFNRLHFSFTSDPLTEILAGALLYGGALWGVALSDSAFLRGERRHAALPSMGVTLNLPTVPTKIKNFSSLAAAPPISSAEPSAG